MFLAVKQVAYLGNLHHLFQVGNECGETGVVAQSTALAELLRNLGVAYHNFLHIHAVLDCHGSGQHVVDIQVVGEPLAHELVPAFQTLLIQQLRAKILVTEVELCFAIQNGIILQQFHDCRIVILSAQQSQQLLVAVGQMFVQQLEQLLLGGLHALAERNVLKACY